jgi:hypothetical protein
LLLSAYTEAAKIYPSSTVFFKMDRPHHKKTTARAMVRCLLYNDYMLIFN